MDSPLIVTGAGRCGTSMAMEMLEAGGYPVAGGPPYYEQPIHVHGMFEGARGEAFDYVPPPGQAVKILSGSLGRLNKDPDYRFVWMSRLDQLAQEASQIRQFGEAVTADMLEWMTKFGPGTSCLPMAFETVRAEPKVWATHLAKFAGGELDVDAMAAVVRP